MSNKQGTVELRGDRELVLTRSFAAPRQRVWQAYTDCAHLSQWWGPTGWELTHCELELRPGGVWHYCMKGEYDGNVMESWGLATYREVDAPSRLVYVDAFSDEDGKVNAEMPQMEVGVTLKEEAGETILTSHTLFESTEARQQVIDMGVVEGITQTWDRLESYLSTM